MTHARLRVLFLSPYVPSHVRVRPYEWVRSLAALGHEVHLLALRPPEDAWAPTAELERLCASLTIVPLSRGRTLASAALALAGRAPLQFAYAHHPRAERLAASLARRHDVDVVHVEHLRGAVLASRLRGRPIVFDAVDAIAPLFAAASTGAPSRAQRWMARLDQRRTARFEASVAHHFDRVVVTSPAEAASLGDGTQAQNRVVPIPNGVDLERFSGPWTPVTPPEVLFSGKLSYHANEAAALRLVERIMPHVWRVHPDARVVLAGKDPSERLRALQGPHVVVTGYVDDLAACLRRARVAVSPLVYGAGIQNKVLEAMACGVPVVAAPQAVSALDVVPDRDVLVAGDDEALAQQIAWCLAGAAAAAIGAAGRRYVEQHHQWSSLAARLVDVYEAAIAESRLRG